MNKFLNRLVGVLLVAVRFVLEFLAESVRLLASSARTTPADDELSSTIRGGDLNFRTGKFDDGTDPAGWYGRD